METREDGALLAAGLSALVLERYGWRALFLIGGRAGGGRVHHPPHYVADEL